MAKKKLKIAHHSERPDNGTNGGYFEDDFEFLNTACEAQIPDAELEQLEQISTLRSMVTPRISELDRNCLTSHEEELSSVSTSQVYDTISDASDSALRQMIKSLSDECKAKDQKLEDAARKLKTAEDQIVYVLYLQNNWALSDILTSNSAMAKAHEEMLALHRNRIGKAHST